MYGDVAASAAAIHILRDCRHIPRANHYTIGFVDQFGLRKSWPTSAYVRYSEEDFTTLVELNLRGSSGLLLWSFIDNENIAGFLGSMTRLTPDEVRTHQVRWTEAYSKRLSLPPLEPRNLEPAPLPESVKPYIDDLGSSPIFAVLRAQHPEFEIRLVPVDQLVCPLALIDNAYLEELRAELQGNDFQDYVRFALPKTLSAALKVASSDPTMHSVTFISQQKTVAVGPVQLQQTADGLEVKFTIASTLAMIFVSQVGERLILKTGVHRSFLLAQLGIKQIPCIFVRESQLQNPLSAAYPSFHPGILLQPRPPLLTDLFDPSLSTEIPLHNTRKVIRISAEESIIPID